ncbi:MAG: hypothetical protein JNG84_10465 [Archangium sp.]|nr:hypothetical protein [Archangium sp.]
MRHGDRVFGVLMVAGALACHPVVVPVPLENSAPVERYVDASAAPDGDGSASAPWRTLPTPFPPGDSVVHLLSGLYTGPFSVPPGVVLEGRGAVVVTREGDGSVVEMTGGVLRGLSIQGGAIGVEVRGEVVLERVHVSGQREAGVVVREGASLRLRGGTFVSRMAEARVVVVRGGAAQLDDVTFSGSYPRGVEAVQAQVTLQNVRFEGGRIGLHAVDSRSGLQQVSATGGTGPAFFAARGSLDGSDLTVLGHEYAVQTGAGTTVTLTRLSSKRALMSAVSLVGSTARLTELDLEGSGAHGGLTSLDSALTVTGLRVRRATAMAVFIRKGQAHIDGLEVEGVAAERAAGSPSLGDAVHVRDATVQGGQWRIRDVEGSAVYAAAFSTVTVDSIDAQRSAVSAITAENGASVSVKTLTVGGALEAGAVALERGVLHFDRYEARGVTVPLWVDCAQGASAHVGELRTSTPPLTSSCVRIDAAPRDGLR